MKRFWLFSAMVLLSALVGAQDYQISFAVLDDNETVVDSIVVQNMEQGNSITVRGNDILHLLASNTGISDLNKSNEMLEVYPNPFTDRTSMVFQNAKQGFVQLSLFDMCGRIIAQNRMYQLAGKNIVEVSGLAAGVYVVQINTETSFFGEVILSNNASPAIPEIIFKGLRGNDTTPVTSYKTSNKTRKMVEMQYNTGDTLSLTAHLGNLSSETKIVPVASTTIRFEFRPEQEDISATDTITIEGGVLQVIDETGNIVKLTFPPGAVMDSTSVSLTLLGVHKDIPIDERRLRTFEIRPLDIKLYEPILITIKYNTPISEIEKTALFRLRSEEWLTPLSDHTFSDDSSSVTASTLFPGDFAEGKISLAQLNTQFDLLVSSHGISWESPLKSARAETQTACDTRIHKALWDDWRDISGAFLTILKKRLLLGYYNELEEGQHTFEEDQELLCTNVVAEGIQDVLDLCIPDDLCDLDYTHTLASMVNGMYLLGCEGSILDRLEERFDQMLIDCGSFLTINSELNIESGGLVISTAGTVPITMTKNTNGTANVEGTGTLVVSGSGSGGGACSSVVSGETRGTVQGIRNAAFTYELQVFTEQNAVLTTTCPETIVNTPLVGEDVKLIHLSRANEYRYAEGELVEGGTFVMEITLNNPYIDLPYENR